MARVKRGNKRVQRRKKILKLAKGYYGTKSKAHRMAKQAVDKSLGYAYRDRRQKKRQFRSLWIVRINAAARLHGLSYSRLIAGLKAAGSDARPQGPGRHRRARRRRPSPASPRRRSRRSAGSPASRRPRRR